MRNSYFMCVCVCEKRKNTLFPSNLTNNDSLQNDNKIFSRPRRRMPRHFENSVRVKVCYFASHLTIFFSSKYHLWILWTLDAKKKSVADWNGYLPGSESDLLKRPVTNPTK